MSLIWFDMQIMHAPRYYTTDQSSYGCALPAGHLGLEDGHREQKTRP